MLYSCRGEELLEGLKQLLKELLLILLEKAFELWDPFWIKQLLDFFGLLSWVLLNGLLKGFSNGLLQKGFCWLSVFDPQVLVKELFYLAIKIFSSLLILACPKIFSTNLCYLRGEVTTVNKLFFYCGWRD